MCVPAACEQHAVERKGSGEADSAPAPRSQRYYIVVSSAVFALRFLALAAFAPYIFLWLESNGFNTHSRGVLGALSGLARFFSPMVVGALADWSGRRKLIFVAGMLGNAAATAALPLVPRSFGAQAVLLALGGLVEPGSLVDAFVMRSLAWAGVASAAARARAFGALSWAAAAPLFGALSTSYGLPTLFWAYCALNVFVAAPVILLLPIDAAYAAVAAPAAPAAAATAAAATTATAATAATTATTAAVATSGDIATSTAPPAAPPPAAPLSFARRARDALCGREACSVQLRFCVPMVALVGFQMGVGFAWGFIYLKQGLHASGLLIGCSLTFQAAIEAGPPPPPSCNPIHPAARRIEAATGSLQPAPPTPCITACGPGRAGAPLPRLRMDHRRPGRRAYHAAHHLTRGSSPDGRLVGRAHYGPTYYGRAHCGRAHYGPTYYGPTYCGRAHYGPTYYGPTYYGRAHYGRAYCELTVALLWLS